MAQKAELLAFHRYFLNADRMRNHFDELLKTKAIPVEMSESIEHNIYMHLWYGCLRAVIEGWKDLNLSDPSVDCLLDPEKVALLNGVRNDTFHFQKEYIPARTQKMLNDSEFVAWVRSSHSAIGDALLKMLRSG